MNNKAPTLSGVVVLKQVKQTLKLSGFLGHRANAVRSTG